MFVCENPNIVSIAADRLGERCAPLVCTEGMPAAAQRALLSQLSDSGGRLRYHGDFDWPGLRIAGHVMRSWRAETWRFAAVDYEAAVAAAPPQRNPLAGPAVEAAWDTGLGAAMRRHGLSIPEEAVVATLLEDLRSR